MARSDNLHSRVVAWLKVVLPLLALALLSTLFLVARFNDNGTELPFSQNDLAEMAREQQIEGPKFAGLTGDGRRIEIAARTAVPKADDHNVVTAADLRGTMFTGTDSRIDVAARDGTIFVDKSSAVLRGDVQIMTSTGYTVVTDELETALDRIEMTTPGEVIGQGPIGRIQAGRMTVVPGGDQNDVTVVFKDGVKLIYVPPDQ